MVESKQNADSAVLQDISLDAEGLPLIVNVVEFGKWGVLRVEAEANTDSRPLPGFTPRQGAGLPIFGKSSTYPPSGKVLSRPAFLRLHGL